MDSSKPRSSLFRNLLLLTGGSTALAIGLVFLGVWQTGNRLFAGVHTLFAPPSAPQVDISTVIVNQIRGASELTTAVFTMEAVIPTSQERKLGEIVVAETKLLYIAHGEVRAGVDLSQLTADDVAVREDTVQIQLPPPQILDSKIDVERSKVYDYNKGLLGLGPDAATQLQTLAQRRSLQKVVEAACSQGILAEANERAELAVAQLLKTSGHEAIEVEVSSPDAQACTPTTN
ncbi:MAG: DUF4230 domain-containing protein [Cyanophyceae cyanobacterium]